MKQLPLRITPRLSYSPDNFLLHEGVRETYTNTLGVLGENRFGICFVYGPARSGKTHFSIAMVEALTQLGRYPLLLEGSQLFEWIVRTNGAAEVTADDVVIIDDAHSYLNQIAPGDSGQFVNFVEHLRIKAASLLLLSAVRVSELPCDDHVCSRVLPGSGFVLGGPGERDMSTIIASLAKQRGIILSDRKLLFLQNRLPRDINVIEDYLDRVSHLSKVLNSPIKFPILTDAMIEE